MIRATVGSNTGMGFLRTNDLSEIKTGELNLDFGVWIKTRGVVGCKLERNKIKCKIEPLEVSGHWFRVRRHSTCIWHLLPLNVSKQLKPSLDLTCRSS